MNLPNQFRPRLINCVNLANLEQLYVDLNKREYRVIKLDGKKVYDKKSFLLQAARDLPQPIDMIATDNWDALSDNLWWSFSEISETNVAIIWTDAQMMLIRGLLDLLMAVSIFENLAKAIATTDHGFPDRKSLTIFLVGTGDNFPD